MTADKEPQYAGFLERDQNDIVEDILDELAEAERDFPRFNSGHEGYAVILEEVEELWDEIKLKSGQPLGRYKEAMQVAAMAIRFMKNVR